MFVFYSKFRGRLTQAGDRVIVNAVAIRGAGS